MPSVRENHALPVQRRRAFAAENEPGKSSRRVNLRLWLAAHDVVRDGQSLGKKAPLGAFLLGHCESCQELRNHQKSAESRFRELDTSLGRLDKKLSYWIRENAKLDHTGFFTAAADGAAF